MRFSVFGRPYNARASAANTLSQLGVRGGDLLEMLGFAAAGFVLGPSSALGAGAGHAHLGHEPEQRDAAEDGGKR